MTDFKYIVTLETHRTGYSMNQISDNCRTMTVGELRRLLEDYDEDTEIMFSNDNGYTYGEITSCDVVEHCMRRENEDDDWEETDW